MDIKYGLDIQEPVLSILKDRISRIVPLFPTWCTLLIVAYDENPEEEVRGSPVAIHLQYKYRFAKIYLYPHFLTETEWYECLLHELHHAVFAPYVTVAENIVNTFISDEVTKQYLLKQLEEAEESVVEDSKHCIKCLLDIVSSDVVT